MTQDRGRELESCGRVLGPPRRRGVQGAPQVLGQVGPTVEVPELVGEAPAVARRFGGEHLEIAVLRQVGTEPQVVGSEPDALSSLGQSGPVQSVTPGGTLVGRPTGCLHDHHPPPPGPRACLAGAALGLAFLTVEKVAGQPIAARTVGGRFAGGHHAAQGHSGPVLGDAEETSQADQVGDGQLGRGGPEQSSGQHRAGGEGPLTNLHHLSRFRNIAPWPPPWCPTRGHGPTSSPPTDCCRPASRAPRSARSSAASPMPETLSPWPQSGLELPFSSAGPSGSGTPWPTSPPSFSWARCTPGSPSSCTSRPTSCCSPTSASTTGSASG